MVPGIGDAMALLPLCSIFVMVSLGDNGINVQESINQSINQSNFYSTNTPGKARLSGATAESVFNSKIDEKVPWHQRAVRCAGV